MNATLHRTIQTRKNFKGLIHGLSIQDLNKIPSNFNNNLVWNFGHIVVTQQLLCYRLAGLDTYLDDDLINQYRKGSKPTSFVSLEEFNELINLSKDMMVKFQEDLEKNIFTTYTPYQTSYGLELTSIADALDFNAMHEAMHLGYAMALRKAIW